MATVLVVHRALKQSYHNFGAVPGLLLFYRELAHYGSEPFNLGSLQAREQCLFVVYSTYLMP